MIRNKDMVCELRRRPIEYARFMLIWHFHSYGDMELSGLQRNSVATACNGVDWSLIREAYNDNVFNAAANAATLRKYGRFTDYFKDDISVFPLAPDVHYACGQ